jgi:hypothetical protein
MNSCPLKRLLGILFQNKDHEILRSTTKRKVIISPLPSNFTATPLPLVACDGDVPNVLPGNMFNAHTGESLGPRGREPTRYGDWENKGRCWDF